MSFLEEMLEQTFHLKKKESLSSIIPISIFC